MKVTLLYFSPSPSATPGFVGQLCRVETPGGPVEGHVLIDERELDRYVTTRAMTILRAFGDRRTLRELGDLPDDEALRAFIGLPGRRQ